MNVSHIIFVFVFVTCPYHARMSFDPHSLGNYSSSGERVSAAAPSAAQNDTLHCLHGRRKGGSMRFQGLQESRWRTSPGQGNWRNSGGEGDGNGYCCGIVRMSGTRACVTGVVWN